MRKFDEMRNYENPSLRLVEGEDCTMLVMVDGFGNRVDKGKVLEINSKGEIVLFSKLSEDLGFELDESGKVKLIDGGERYTNYSSILSRDDTTRRVVEDGI